MKRDHLKSIERSDYILYNKEEFVRELKADQIEIFSIKLAKSFPKVFGSLKIKKIVSKADGGFFLHVKEGAKVSIPIKTCFFIDSTSQNVVNIVYAEKNSEINVYTTCLGKTAGEHRARNFILVEQSAKVKFIESHRWAPKNKILSRSYVYLEDFSEFEDIYINLDGWGKVNKKIKYIVCNNVKLLSKSEVKLNSGEFILKNFAYIKGNNSTVNLSSRAVVYEGFLSTHFKLDASGKNIKGYSKCDGILLGNGKIQSIPEIYIKDKSSYLYHEASVGRIPEEVIEYFRMRGLSKEEAIDLFVKGFLQIDSKKTL